MSDEQDKKDAERWRKVAAFLRVEVKRDERWQTVAETRNKRTEEKTVEWTWNIDVHPDHAWKLYGSTKDEAKVPKSLDDVIDALDDIHGDQR